MVREFELIDEKGQTFSLMDIENHALLTDPDGLGYSYSSDYTKTGEIFVNNLREQTQLQITGVCNFLYYENYTNLVNFIESSHSLRMRYRIPMKSGFYREFYKDIQLQSLGKTEKSISGILSCPISFDMLTLWYEEKKYSYDMSEGENEVRWNFKWGSKFVNYNSRRLSFNNQGHTLAPVYLEIDGPVEDPEITITDSNNNQLFHLRVEIQIFKYEKFIYSSMDGNIRIAKQNIDGTYTSLFTNQYIDITNNNIFKLPQGVSNIIIQANDDIMSASLNIYPYYKSI